MRIRKDYSYSKFYRKSYSLPNCIINQVPWEADSSSHNSFPIDALDGLGGKRNIDCSDCVLKWNNGGQKMKEPKERKISCTRKGLPPLPPPAKKARLPPLPPPAKKTRVDMTCSEWGRKMRNSNNNDDNDDNEDGNKRPVKERTISSLLEATVRI